MLDLVKIQRMLVELFYLNKTATTLTYITLVGKEERVTGAPGKVASISLSSELLAVRSIRVV